MTKDEVFEFIKANPVCALATANQKNPQARDLGLYILDAG